MRIATWNVNSINARRAYVLDWLETRRPDIACLQELKIPDDDFPLEAVRELGYDAAVHGQKSWNGVAVLARSEIGEISRGLPGQDEAGSRVITADIDGVAVTSVYVPNGKSVDHADFEMKIGWLAAFGDYVEAIASDGREQLIGGDFNVVPTGLDSYHPDDADGSILHSKSEREAYERLIEIGLVDVFRATAPNEPGYSWWDYRGGSFHKGRGLRIDLLLASPSLADRVSSVAVDRTFRKKRKAIWDVKPSDHAPVEAILV